jgi:hypothetical protein
MNTLIDNLTQLITGTDSPDTVKELKPYLVVFHLNMLGLLGLKIMKIISLMP